MISDRFKDSLIQIQTQWCLEDMMDAHEALDIVEALEKEQRDKPPPPKS